VAEWLLALISQYSGQGLIPICGTPHM
jgi:hypothetical protein